jgi:ATP-binding cassette subfamily F protein 3
MLIVSNISYINQGKKLLDGVSFTLDRERKVIVGDNGCGKTTLLEIIVGNLPKESGDVTINGKVAYVPQEIKDINLTALEEIESTLAHVKEIEKRLEQLEKTGNFGEEYGRLLEKYGENGGYSYKQKIYEMLNKFTLDKAVLERKMHELSGGERTKCEIIKSLLTEPDILIIDEPTNHLDIETIEALEEMVLKFKGGVLIVSHDRTFINKIATHILYLESGHIKEYHGNYDKFKKLKEEFDEQTKKERKKLLKYVEKERAFIEKFRYGTRSTQAKSREKRLEQIEIPEVHSIHKKTIKLESGERGGEIVAELYKIRKKFDGKEILKGLDLFIKRGERVGIVGRNGSGKTTLLKIIAGIDKNFEGRLRVGDSIEIGYFPQDSFVMDENATPLEEILKDGLTAQESRDLLAIFDITDSDVFKKISEFSGGEKRKLLLAKMSLIKGNFLVMDEPTNHLDIETNEIVTNALKEFNGTILIVTHDRFLLKELTNKVYFLEDGILKNKINERETVKGDSLEKERNKIKARVEYLEKLLSKEKNEKRLKELRLLKKKLQELS